MLPMDVPGCSVLDIQSTEQGLQLTVETDSRNHACPGCGHVSDHPHSWYVRQLRDLPMQGKTVRLRVIAHRWRCLNQGCSRKTFSDQLVGLARRYAQRTERLTETLQRLILGLSSTISATVARGMGIEVSGRTLLRTVSHQEVQVPTPRVLGVDDFALSRGRQYGTLLCDLETGKPIDVLVGRSKEPLLEWLKRHPGVKIIVRDRASSYADAARDGAPDAIQVADRFHLVLNVSGALREVVDRQSWDLPTPTPLPVSAPEQESAPAPAPAPDPEVTPDCPPAKRLSRDERRRAAAAERLKRRYEEVHRLHSAGKRLHQIQKETGFSPNTIKKYLAANQVPKRAEHPRVPSILDPFADYLGERWRDGCHNARTLYEEIVQQGYSGSLGILRRLLRPWREACPPAPRPPRALSTRKDDNKTPPVTWKAMRWTVLCPPERLTSTQRPLLKDFLDLHPPLATAHQLVHEFRRILKEHDIAAYAKWLTDAEQSKLAPFERLAKSLRSDHAAVLAAIELPWSTGQVEGHITRVKFVKRIGYGRASFALLRARILGFVGGESRSPARTACAM